MPKPSASGQPAGPPDPGPLSHLGVVEELLSERMEHLARVWRQGSWTTDAVLGADADVPELLTTLVMAGGKRLRPQMCWWGWVASGVHDDGYNYLELARLSAAMEMLHAFGLAQDDVMDDSALRRGAPALHVLASARHTTVAATGDARRYGQSVAVLAGDLAHAEADALVAGLPEPVRTMWWRMSIELVRGQTRDLSAAASTDPDGALDRALEIAHAKSGAYTVQYPLQLGAALGGAGTGVMQTLGHFGRLLGLAFALRDDLLGVWGDPDITGKPSSDDLTDGKSTVLLALAGQRCTGAAGQAVARMRRQAHDEDDVAAVREAMVTTGVRAEVEERIEQLAREARTVLREGALPAAAVDGLEAVTGRIAWRSS